MPADRILRFTIAGTIFEVSLFFFYFFFGGNVSLLIKDISSNNLFVIVTLLSTSPIIGIIISTILHSLIVQVLIGYRIYYKPPSDAFVVQELLRDNQPLLKNIVVDGETKWSRATVRKFFPHHQAKVKTFITGDRLYFLERRWSVFWTYSNVIFAVILSLFLTCGYRFFVSGSYTVILDLNYLKVTGVVVVVIFVVTAWLQLINARNDALTVEDILLSEKIREEIKQH
jgi:hypothetical protein